MSHKLAILFVFAATSIGFAGPAPGTWSSIDPTNLIAFGEVDGIGVTATTNADAPFSVIATDRFSVGGAWDADGLPLPSTAQGLGTIPVNGGDSQQFDFDVPWLDGYFYIENFDSSSLATISVTGGATMSLAAASASITFSPADGQLATSNATFNGEGDAVIKFDGAVESILIEYDQGEQANGIFYGFAFDDDDGGDGPTEPPAIPEPASILVWLGCLAVGLTIRRRLPRK